MEILWKYLGVFDNDSGLLVVADPGFVGDGEMMRVLPLGVKACHVHVAYEDCEGLGVRISRVLIGPAKVDGLPNRFLGDVRVDTGGLVVFSDGLMPLWKERDQGLARSGQTFIDRNGVHWHCALHGEPPPIFAGRSFFRFSDPIREHGGMCMNDLRSLGLVTVNEYAINGDEFSHDGAFATRCGDGDCGFLKIEGKSIALAFSPGFGDGLYDIFADDHAVMIVCIDPES